MKGFNAAPLVPASHVRVYRAARFVDLKRILTGVAAGNGEPRTAQDPHRGCSKTVSKGLIWGHRAVATTATGRLEKDPHEKDKRILTGVAARRCAKNPHMWASGTQDPHRGCSKTVVDGRLNSRKCGQGSGRGRKMACSGELA